MDVRGPFFLKICLALLLSVCALQCYEKSEIECKPSGPNCGGYAGLNVPMTVSDCDSDVTMCFLMDVQTSGGGATAEIATSGCLPKAEGFNYKNDCYGKRDIGKISPEAAQQIKQLEALSSMSIDKVEICICDGNLCNGSIKSAFSISVITISVIMIFLLFT